LQFVFKPKKTGNNALNRNTLKTKNNVHILVHNKVHLIVLTTTLSDFRKDIKRYFDTITQNLETLIINRGKDNGIVIMSLAEYNALRATQHEMSSKQNERRLDAAIEKLKSGNSSSKNLLEGE